MDWRTRGEQSPSRENREHSRYFDCLREVCAFTCSAHATPFPHSSIHVVAQDWKHGARKSFRFYAITRATWAIRYEKEGGEINNGGKNRAWKLNRALRSKLSNNYFKSLLSLIKSIFSSSVFFFLSFLLCFFVFRGTFRLYRYHFREITLNTFSSKRDLRSKILLELSLIKAKNRTKANNGDFAERIRWKHFPPNFFPFPTLWFHGPINFRISQQQQIPSGISKIIYRNYTLI